MNTLRAFLAQNAKKIEKQTMIVSDRFCDENGAPVPFEYKCITNAENAALRRASMVQKPVPGKEGQTAEEVDFDLFTAKLIARCTIFPDLENAELQDSYGVCSPEELIQTMLNPGEFSKYHSAILEINGFGKPVNLVKEAKN